MNYDIYKQGKTKEALEYQDFICEWLAKNYGIVLTIFTSQKKQYKGESLQGFEIKYDMKYKETGNIYIEIGEKSEPREGEYIKSGILRNDNTWLYLIGNYKTLYIFSKKQLISIYEKKLYYKYIPDNNTETSEGFLLTENMADKYCIKKIEFI